LGDAPEKQEDWTGDETAPVQSPQEGRKYDPSEDREKIRGRIAQGLLFTLVGIVAGIFLTVWLKLASLDDVLKLVAAVLTPVIGVFGAVTGFYFGSSRRRGSKED
jgi:hypothetical protein